ncbi:MAG: FHA domain-containing protein [Gemmatimonadetes bacterium]|nr:FHA domain-containing protein [Gemmatimonadota bacterium]
MIGWVIAAAGLAGLAWVVLRARRRVRPVAKLQLLEGGEITFEFPLRVMPATIGREDGQTVAVSHPRVSRQHAAITRDGEHFVLHDRSKHGTRVNGQVIETHVLASGDLILLADAIQLIFTRL